jgi:hypothetical protein
MRDNSAMKMSAILRNRIIGYRVDPELVDAYRSAIPNYIQLSIAQNGDSYLATITELDHEPMSKKILLVTEARTHEELIDMVNDLIFTYKRIPENYRPFYKQILKPEGEIKNSKSLSLVKSA